MENAQTILVIFLSVVLALFLVLSCILLALFIKIARQVKRIIDKAEAITDKAESLAEFFERAATPMAVGRYITSVTEMLFHRKKK